MAYLGTTSSAPNTPFILGGPMARTSTSSTARGYTLWAYGSTHLSSDIYTVNFFGRDAQRLGFLPGDVLLYFGPAQVSFTQCVSNGATTSLFSTNTVLVGSSS